MQHLFLTEPVLSTIPNMYLHYILETMRIIMTARQNDVAKGLFTLFEVLVSHYSYYEIKNKTFNASTSTMFQQSGVAQRKLSSSNTYQRFPYYRWSYKSNGAFIILHCLLTTQFASSNSEMTFIIVMHILVAGNSTSLEP